VGHAAKKLPGSRPAVSGEELDPFFSLSLDLLMVASVDGLFKRLNPALERTLGYTQEELQSQPFMDFVHPDDCEATLAEAAQLASGRATVSFENRYRCRDGSYVWLAWTAAPALESGLIYCVARDVTERKRADREMAEMRQAFAAISGVAREVSLGTDARKLVCTAAISSTNATLATVVEPRADGFAITGSAGIPIEAAELRSVQPAASLTAYRTARRVFIPDVSQDPGVSPAIVRATGIVSALYEPILRHGHPVGVICVAWATPRTSLDANTEAVIQFLAAEAGAAIERADLLARLDHQARSDQLTALPNRRAWDETLTHAITQPGPLCMAMIDIDHFKQFNDQHGHAAGDRLLRACALAWKSQLRPSDTLARYGGEEFAVLLPNCVLADATNVLERLRRATPRGATASVGVAERQSHESAGGVLARADTALYQAKHPGRNRLQAA
jgi:diguanylate cyclase (GGDEF)-like protein/PAS domain S-box-containing protein